MRLVSVFFRNARQPQDENKVVFKAIQPLKLNNRVTSKSQKVAEHGCLYELSLLLTCLEENEYENKQCVPQFRKLDDCYKNYTEKVQRAQIEHEQVVPVPNSKSYTDKQITYLLRRYPTV